MSAVEETLIARSISGDTAAFEALVNSHARYVYNLALRLVHDPHEAEDIAQDAFLRAWRGLPQFRGRSKFSTWLYTIVTRLCYDRLPRIRQDLLSLAPTEEALALEDERQTVEPELLTAEMRRCLHAAIDNLPQGYRLLINLRHLQEMSYEEIAQVTGMPLGTVKAGIYRARLQLKKVLEAEEVEQ